MSASPPDRSAGLWAASLLGAQFVLMWTTFFVLYSAIGWPASLDDPASIALPRLVENQSSVLIGYGCYLMVALLLVPATAAINSRLGVTGSLAGLLLSLATLSAFAKVIGISRWLFVMPELAARYAQPGADRGEIELLYSALNSYAGGIGEIVGVGFTAGIWSLLVAWVLLRATSAASTALAGAIALTGIGLLLTIPAGFGLDLGPVLTLAGIAWQFALLAIGLWALTPARAR